MKLYLCLILESFIISIIFHGKFHKVGDESTPFSSNAYITIPFCVGQNEVEKQCLHLLYDIEARYTLLIDNGVLPKDGYNPSMSSTYFKAPNKGYITSIPPSVSIFSYFIKDYIFFDEYQENRFERFSMLEAYKVQTMNSSNIDYQGILGLSTKSDIGTDLLIIHYLRDNRLISSSNFYQKFISKNDVDIYIGETDIDKSLIALNNFEYCKLAPQSSFAINWYCTFDYVGTNNGENIIKQFNESNHLVQFHSTWKTMSVPVSIWEDIMNFFIHQSNNKCFIIKDESNKTSVYPDEYLQCPPDLNVSIFPDLILGYVQKNLKIKIRAIDIFTKELKCIFQKNRETGTWHLGMDIIKHYNIYFDNQSERIGFQENFIFDNSINTSSTIIKPKQSDKSKEIIIYSLFVILCIGIICIYFDFKIIKGVISNFTL